MLRSDNLTELSKALISAQSAFPALVKDATNPHFRSKYADLATVVETTRAPLAKAGLTVVQTTEFRDDGATVLLTTLLHTSGQFITSTYPLVPVKNDPQGMGSALTYARRYGLMAIVGIAPEDDDGNDAARPDDRATETTPRRDFSSPSQPRVPDGVVSEGLRVTDVKVTRGVGKPKGGQPGKPYTKYNITLSDGRVAATFDNGMYEAAQLAKSRGLIVEVSTQRSPYGLDLLHLEPTIQSDTALDGNDTLGDPPPLSDDDIPF